MVEYSVSNMVGFSVSPSLSSLTPNTRPSLRICPVVLISSLCVRQPSLQLSCLRGMTLAPRVEVYTQLACRALHGDPQTTTVFDMSLDATPSFAISSHSSSPSSKYSVPVNLPDISTLLMDECSADPKVQARAARIQASVKTTESILSAATTGWLSHLSDLYGRKKILGLSIFGALFMDFVYILVSNTKSGFGRHGEAFIITAPLIEGFLGAQSTYNGLTHAYATDCTADGSRARIFSMLQGMLYVGLASGPWLNGIVLNVFGNSTTATLFMLAIAIAITNLFFVLFVVPESLAPDRRLSHSPSYLHERTPSLTRDKSAKAVVKRTFALVTTQFLRPVALFVPRRLEGRRGRNWNLTLTGLTLFIYVLSIQVYNLKYLYVRHVYGWTSEQLGYYMSLLWITRAMTLLLILPAVLTYFSPDRNKTSAHSTPENLASALRFDQRIAMISFFTDASANALVSISPTSSQALFILFTSLNSLTSGGNPALNSLGAVSLQAMGRGREIGLVFGAMGIVNAVGHIIAPGIYAAIYGATVADFPKMIFVMSAFLLYIAVAMLARIRPSIDVQPSEAEIGNAYHGEDGDGEGSSLSGEGTETESDRGRSRKRDDDRLSIQAERVRRSSIILSVSEETL
ncbi:hypothetical protein EW146_g4090 [Bondarzewia mesenterica]|uniref:Major facilitator superfamily (MFS) profile domain-containing protein n=1 Tax=Bondarzewia mesenterica TaxID=1095465 RepID=A0A4S4LXS1_9AGAM|nr:hypothetical protein EW146_g4090 [Bondarzewia mesenterica]